MPRPPLTGIAAALLALGGSACGPPTAPARPAAGSASASPASPATAIVAIEPSSPSAPAPAAPAPAPAPAGSFVKMAPVRSARWSPDAARDAQLDRWASESESYGSFALLATQAEHARIAVPRDDIELWPWIELEAATTVVTGATPLRPAPQARAAATLAGGLPVEILARQDELVQVRASVSLLSSSVTLTGWIDAPRIGKLYRREPLPPLGGKPLQLDIPMRTSLPILATPEGPPIASIDQRIMALYAWPTGNNPGKLRGIQLLLEDEDGTAQARIDGFIAAGLLPDSKSSGSEVVDSVSGPVWTGTSPGVAAPKRSIASGSCLFIEGHSEPVGRTLLRLAPTTPGGSHIEHGGLTLQAKLAAEPPCRPSAKP